MRDEYDEAEGGMMGEPDGGRRSRGYQGRFGVGMNAVKFLLSVMTGGSCQFKT